MKVQRAKGAILVESRAPLVVDEFDLPETLEAGQVLVKIHYTSICGAQINEIAAVKGPDKYLPHLLGHEATATVLEIGPGVTTVAEGDTVVLHWRPSKGIQSKPPAYSWRGQKLNAGWVTTFNDHAVVSENRVTLLPTSFDPKVAPLLGCAVTTALGVIQNDAKVALGDSVVVFGAGGVGLNMVQCASLTGAYPVVAVDLVEAKLEMAKRFGATHVFNPTTTPDIAAAIRDIVGAGGADKVIETTGVKQVIETAYEVTQGKGTCVLVGVPSEKVTIYTLPLHFKKILTGSEGGDSVPDRDIPRIAKLEAAGRMSFEGLITHEFPLDRINEALDVVRSGEAGRVLVTMEP
ncbi:zinc-binding dehydrogenase [Mangrovibrevibacter kandeliae]|uniref:zinc-binding dehydrogenase n=1 Tax=Mangrovibrevibacter kandeliae TaxID=2968473 RepID=UPI002118849A|nr:zinc-binding dehydrogenase [Aurantimonas sp. CSK15Z-1]MCQ8782816.1 zinc-binding dehydrogenase [Aurantimonas sp. CSK15Z-1]